MPTKTKPFVKDNQLLANQAKAKALGVTIPGVSGKPTDTPASTYGSNLNSYKSDSYDTALGNSATNAYNDSNQKINENSIYRGKLNQYQKEIDAVNQIYTQQLNTARIEGQGRLGSGRAIQARSGTLGSDFSTAQNESITQSNNDILSGLQGEQALAVQAILGKARKDAQDEVSAKRLAKTQGADSYLKYLGEQTARKESKLNTFASSILDQDLSKIDPKNLEEVAKSYGTTVDDLKYRVAEAKGLKDKEKAKNTLETEKTTAEIAKINADIARGKLIEIGEGTTLYNTETGETFKNPKTYAPSSNGTGGAILPVGGATPFVGQANYNNLNAKQKTQADSLNNLVRSLNEYKTYYEANPGSFGGKFGNLVGADSGLLETKLNSIIFAAAQAEGTGALQAADRQVIEKIVPNPTSLSGAFNTATKGGKSANVTRIEDQIKKYTDNLAGFGLSPASLPGASNATTPSTQTLTSPDGKQEVNVSDLTPAELKEAKDAGWL